MLYNELPLPLPFYDRLTDQARYKENTINPEVSELIVPHDRLIPFQFRFITSAEELDTVKIYDIDGEVAAEIDPDEISKTTANGWDYWYWKAEAAIKKSDTTDLNLACGLYYIEISVNSVKQYSELFAAKTYTSAETFPYLLIQFSNTTSIAPVYYGDGYVNKIYLDSYITKPTPVIDVETEKDGYGTEVIIAQKLSYIYEIAAGLLPNFIVKALTFMAINSQVIVTEKSGGRSGSIYNINIKQSDEFGKSLSAIDITFDENQVIFKNTCDGIQPPEVDDNDIDEAYDGIIDDGLNNDEINYEDI